MPIIEVENLGKVFQTAVRREGRFGTLLSLFRPDIRQFVSVSDLSFSVESGESVAYLGPNGAGKSTTIKMLTGVLEPSSGRVLVGGLVPSQNRKRNSYRIGVVYGQRTQLLYDLPVRDSFDLLRYMYAVPYERYRKIVSEYANYLDISHLLDKPVRTLSLGQRMRCEILAALIHDPEILFLDEPTIGLDPVAKERIRAFIAEMNLSKKVTVLLTTHDLADIEKLCPRLIIIDKGTKIYDGSLQLIKERFATERKIRAVMPGAEDALMMEAHFGGHRELAVTTQEQVLEITYDQRFTESSELLRIILSKTNPRDLTVMDESIESLIRRIYQHGIQDDEELDKRPQGILISPERPA